MIYSQLLAYFQSKYRLIYYPIAITSCYTIFASSPTQAQSKFTDVNSHRLESRSLPSASINHRSNCAPPQLNSAPIEAVQPQCRSTLPQAHNRQRERENLSQSDRVAQAALAITVPLTLPIPLSSLLPQSSPIVPLNSILAAPILAPNRTPAVPLINTPTTPTALQDDLIPPKAVDPQQVDPFSTQFVLNGDKISHLTSTVAKSGFESGNFRTSDLNFNVYQVIRADNIQRVTKDRVVRVNTQIESVGINSVAQSREITTVTSTPQTLLGVRQQVSLAAKCQANSEQTCTYLPGISIDDSTIDPRKLQPTGVKITSQYGDIISPTSLATIEQPGFQGGANGERFGVDLYLPAVGLVATPWSLNAPATGVRREHLQTAVAVNYTQMNRDFATNGVESTLSQTIRSVNYIQNDRHQLLNLAVQAFSRLLPEVRTGVAPGVPGARIVVNPNLYRAANAVRIPDNSQTIYQTGAGAALSRGQDPQILPGASHQAIWLGLSPVVERKFSSDYYYLTRNSPQIVNSGGGEGGIPVAVNLNNYGFNSSNLQNPYSQGYVTVYNRDVDRYNIETFSHRTDYYPHISLTGVKMSANSLWRYYTGAIATIGSPSPIKAYIGTDYSIANKQGLRIGIGGIGYLNPDPEYATQLFASASQSIRLGANPRNNLIFGTNANYIVNELTVRSIPVRSTQSYLNAGIALEIGDVSIGATQFFGNLLPASTENKTTFNVGWKITERLNIGAFYTAVDRNISTEPYGASLSLALDPSSNSLLYLGWNATEIDFRRTLGSNANIYRDRTVSISVRLSL
jgi:hypothetical protein